MSNPFWILQLRSSKYTICRINDNGSYHLNQYDMDRHNDNWCHICKYVSCTRCHHLFYNKNTSYMRSNLIFLMRHVKFFEHGLKPPIMADEKEYNSIIDSGLCNTCIHLNKKENNDIKERLLYAVESLILSLSEKIEILSNRVDSLSKQLEKLNE